MQCSMFASEDLTATLPGGNGYPLVLVEFS